MAAAKNPSEATLQAVQAARATGKSLKEIGRQFGVSDMTVRRWTTERPRREPKKAGGRFFGIVPSEETIFADCREQGEQAEQAAPDPEPLPADLQAPAAEEEPEELDTLASVRRMLRDTLKRAKDSEEVGNYGAAQRAGRDAGQLVTVIARLEKASTLDDDILRISRNEIADTMDRVRARVQAICARPLLCTACSRELSIEWGVGGAAETAAAE